MSLLSLCSYQILKRQELPKAQQSQDPCISVDAGRSFKKSVFSIDTNDLEIGLSAQHNDVLQSEESQMSAIVYSSVSIWPVATEQEAVYC